jgi:uncharacterized 2Fe-2S/4Fe-4S cluster protein (DUF4445 family)
MSGILLASGRFNPHCTSSRLHWNGPVGSYELATADETTNGRPLFITQIDVRNIQLAKAALYAGARTLMKRANVEKVDRVILAGAFGSYIDTKHAMVLGLIPDCDLQNVFAVGNAAGDGARIALLNRKKRQEAQELVEWVKYVETAVDPDFQAEFADAIHIPHGKERFTNIADLLPAQPDLSKNGSSRRSRRQVLRKRSAKDEQAHESP